MDKIAYTYGVWDMLHRGHINVIKQAKRFGDKLVVGVYTDKAAKSFKRKPIVGEDERHYMLEQLKDVDMVIFQEDFSPESNIKLIKADVVCKAPGAGWTEDYCPTFDNCESIILQYTKGVSTSERIRKCYDYFKSSDR